MSGESKLRIWYGDGYAAGFRGVRVLVLGEASYGGQTTPPEQLVN